jgi:preprotein translocase subunit SecD
MKKIRTYIALLLVFSALISGCTGPKYTTYVSFVPDTAKTISPGDMLQAQQVLQKRLHDILSGRSTVTLESNALRVGLSNEKDLPLAIEMATQPGLLFFFHSDSPVAAGQPMPAGATVIFTGANIAKASASLDSHTGWWSISITLTPEGKTKLADYTQAHVGAYLVIARDNQVISAPQVNAAITGGQAIIAGNFDKTSAQVLAAQINSGAMPVPLKVVK